jgi:hypothetical protein
LTLSGGSIGLWGSGTTQGLRGVGTTSSATGVRGEASSISGTTYGVYGTASSSSGTGVYGTGNTGGRFLGTNASSPALYVENGSGGDLIGAYGGGNRTFRVTNDGDVYADKAYHCGLGAGAEPGTCLIQGQPADFAEMLPARGNPQPGDVLVIGADGRLLPSTSPYAANVVGVYSTSPSYLGGGDKQGLAGYVPLAITGIVPVKVSAENGPIRPGDLLTASATPGHAMRADPNPPVGTVIGKALAGLDAGTGVIMVLVMLQ